MLFLSNVLVLCLLVTVYSQRCACIHLKENGRIYIVWDGFAYKNVMSKLKKTTQ